VRYCSQRWCPTPNLGRGFERHHGDHFNGARDPMITTQMTRQLVSQLTERGAEVTNCRTPAVIRLIQPFSRRSVA
jgi:hypothetical protein